MDQEREKWFQEKYKTGDEGEAIYAEYEIGLGSTLTKVDDIDITLKSLFDFKVVTKDKASTFYVEVKHDVASLKYNSCIFEVRQNGKESGLYITIACIWVQVLHDRMLFFDTDTLTEYCKAHGTYKKWKNKYNDDMQGWRLEMDEAVALAFKVVMLESK